jgi:hypothetical protein
MLSSKERALKIATYRTQYEIDSKIVQALAIAAGLPIPNKREDKDFFERSVSVATCPEEGGCLAVWSGEKEER